MAEERYVRELAALVAELRVVTENLRVSATALGASASPPCGDGVDGGPDGRARCKRRGNEGVLA